MNYHVGTISSVNNINPAIIKNTFSDENDNVVRTVYNEEKIEPMEIGKYKCEVKLQITPGLLPEGLTNIRKIVAYAYHYLPVSYEVRITIKSNTEQKSRVSKELLNGNSTYSLLLGDTVKLEITYQGYPHPEVKILSSSSDPEYSQREHFHQSAVGTWTMESFGETDQDHVVSLYQEDHTEDIEINFRSETQVQEHDKLKSVFFSLKKVFIVSQVLKHSSDRQFIQVHCVNKQ